jgi:hypothetical protein
MIPYLESSPTGVVVTLNISLSYLNFYLSFYRSHYYFVLFYRLFNSLGESLIHLIYCNNTFCPRLGSFLHY